MCSKKKDKGKHGGYKYAPKGLTVLCLSLAPMLSGPPPPPPALVPHPELASELLASPPPSLAPPLLLTLPLAPLLAPVLLPSFCGAVLAGAAGLLGARDLRAGGEVFNTSMMHDN